MLRIFGKVPSARLFTSDTTSGIKYRITQSQLITINRVPASELSMVPTSSTTIQISMVVVAMNDTCTQLATREVSLLSVVPGPPVSTEACVHGGGSLPTKVGGSLPTKVLHTSQNTTRVALSGYRYD